VCTDASNGWLLAFATTTANANAGGEQTVALYINNLSPPLAL
jgi:hypothetical protein